MANAMVALANITLGSAQSTVTFSSIPSTYRDLRLVIQTTETTGSRYTTFQINGDTGANYSAVQMYGTGSGSGSSAAYSSGNQLVILNNFYESTTEATTATLDFLEYSVANKHKSILWRSGLAGTGVNASIGRWANSASAITSIALISNAGGSNTFAAGSILSLFGVLS